MHAPTPVAADWHGSDDATDFLGLDLEVGASGQAPAAVPLAETQAAAVDTGAPPAADQASSSWLLSLDEANTGQPEPDPVAPEAVQEFTDEDPAPALEAPVESAWPERVRPRKSRKKTAVLALTFALVALAAGAAYLWNERTQGVSDAPLVALVPPPAPIKAPTPPPRKTTDANGGNKRPATDLADSARPDTHKPIPTDDRATPAPTSAGDAVHTSDADAMATADPTSVPTPDATPRTEPTDGGGSVVADSALADDGLDAAQARDTRLAGDRIETWLRAQHGTGSPDSDVGAGPDSSTPFELSALSKSALPDTTDREPNFGMSRSPSANPGAPLAGVEGTSKPMLKSRSGERSGSTSKGGLRRATADDLAGVWEGSVIPMDSIPAPSRLLTPGVGRVRVVIQQGEIFEGRLYAVGQNRIWLDTDLGRLALLSQQVQRIEHLGSPGGTPGLGSPGSQELAGLPRVRVHTPGGTFYGKVIARDDIRVTLITDEGARVMLESGNIESAPLGMRSVVVKPRANR